MLFPFWEVRMGDWLSLDSNSLVGFMIIPLDLCFLFYFFLFFVHGSGTYEIESSLLPTKQINPSSQSVLICNESVFHSSEISLCQWCLSQRLRFIHQTGFFHFRIMIHCCTKGPAKVSAYLRWLCSIAPGWYSWPPRGVCSGLQVERPLTEMGRQTSKVSRGSGCSDVWVLI